MSSRAPARSSEGSSIAFDTCAVPISTAPSRSAIVCELEQAVGRARREPQPRRHGPIDDYRTPAFSARITFDLWSGPLSPPDQGSAEPEAISPRLVAARHRRFRG
jgi:hypothetical protein